ncbi:MAG: DUF1016 N-terminal domain-containing protein [Pseudomonadota bacterium]
MGEELNQPRLKMNRQQDILPELISDIRELILSARRKAVQSVDILHVMANFEIGRRIIVHEQHRVQERAKYGDATLIDLAAVLTDEFGKGFSLTNLKLMCQFYLAYRERIGQTLSDSLKKSVSSRKMQTPSAQFTLSWSHYVCLMVIKNVPERDFYEIEATSQHRSLRGLKRQFNSGIYDELLLRPLCQTRRRKPNHRNSPVQKET